MRYNPFPENTDPSDDEVEFDIDAAIAELRTVYRVESVMPKRQTLFIGTPTIFIGTPMNHCAILEYVGDRNFFVQESSTVLLTEGLVVTWDEVRDIFLD